MRKVKIDVADFLEELFEHVVLQAFVENEKITNLWDVELEIISPDMFN